MSSLPNKAKVGGVVLQRVPEGRGPECYLWKRVLEREWAGEWGTLARLTGYRYKLGLDPAFVVELPQFKKGQIHWFEWVLCDNGGIISLYDEENRIGKVWTTQGRAEKILAADLGAYLFLTSDERLSHELHFPLENILQICELAGARRARTVSEAQRARLRERALEKGWGSPEKGVSNRVPGAV